MTTTLTVGTWNIERFGYAEGRGHHRLPAATEWLLEQTPRAPHILALPEARGASNDGQRTIRGLAHQLSRHLSSGGHYEVLMASRMLPGRRNHLHALLVDTAVARPLQWWDPSGPDASYRTNGFALVEIAGHEVWVCCEHWSGGEGREEFWRAAVRIARYASKPALVLADLNATSSWEREVHHGLDWYELCESRGELHKLWEKGWLNPLTGRWEIDTRQVDFLRLCGWLDMGEEADDPTPTTHADGSRLRIDRILRSPQLPARVVDYGVTQPPRDLSDHAYVHGTYLIHGKTLKGA